MSNLKATITNNLGQVILTKAYNTVNKITLDLNAPNGVYFLQLETENETVTRKIVKQ